MLSKNSSPDAAPRRFEVITGEPERRFYDDDFKAQLVARSFAPGLCIADLAREHGLAPQLLYTWRSEAKRGRLGPPAERSPLFAPVVREDAAPSAGSSDEIVLEIGEIRLRVGPDVAPERVAALLGALRGAP